MTRKILLFCILLVGCTAEKENRYVYQKDLMYTTFDLVVYSSLSRSVLTPKIDHIWKELDILEVEFSPAGEGFVGQLNKNSSITKAENPKIFTTVSNFITRSSTINQQSQGAFDLTVYPLIRLWGFYLQDEGQKVPSDQEISKTLQCVGMEHVILSSQKIALNNNVQIDLGAIAKGYAVDVATSMLTNIEGISAGFVNAGGNIRVYGAKPDKTPWKVGIRNPSGDGIEEIVSLYDGDAIATSGDYEQFFVKDGITYHHIFNPQTGRPVTHNLASVSVVLKGSAERADILATTFLSLGLEKTKDFLSVFDPNEELSLFFISREENQLLTEANTQWEKRK